MTSKSHAITSRFRALDCIDNDVNTNKRYIVPHIYASREPREPGGFLGNIMQPPQSHWNATYWEEGDFVVEDQEILGVPGQGTMCSLFNTTDQRPGDWVWRNLFMSPGEEGTSVKWALRSYATPDCTFEDCDFFAFVKGHSLYISNNQDTTFDRCTFVRSGGQGLQVAHRPNDKTDGSTSNVGANNLHYTRNPQHVLKDCHFIDCGDGGVRASYTATYFDPGTSRNPGTLLVDGCSFVSAFPEAFGHYKSKSRGALVVTPIGSQNEPLTTPMMERVEITNCLFDYTRGDRSIVNIRSTDEILIEDCAFIAREDHRWAHVKIDSPFNAMGSSKSRQITLRNTHARGDCRLKIYRREADGGGSVSYSLDQPGKELVIDAVTGALISERTLTAPNLDELKKTYYGS